MLAINSIKYYSLIKEEILKLDNLISYINENNALDEKITILNKFLNSTINSGSNSHFSYVIERDSNGGKENVKANYLKKFNDFKSDFDMVSFFGTIRELENSFNKICEEFRYKDLNCSNLIERFNTVANLYQKVIQNESNENIIIFFEEIEKLCTEYYFVTNSLSSFTDSLKSNYDEILMDMDNVLEIQMLEVEFGLGEFGETLSYLENSYNSIKMLFPELDVENLKIVKVESGSLLAMILGDKNVIQLLTDILKKISVEIYQKFTANGKLEKQSNVFKSISEASDLSKKMNEMGIDTTKANENLESCLNVATNNLFKIVEKTGKLKINNDIICIGEEQKLLQYKTVCLEHKDIEDNGKND